MTRLKGSNQLIDKCEHENGLNQGLPNGNHGKGDSKTTSEKSDTDILYKVYETPPLYLTILLGLQVIIFTISSTLNKNRSMWKCYFHFD